MSEGIDTYDEDDAVPLGDVLKRVDGMRLRGVDPFAVTRLTDTGNAERWVSQHGSRFRFHAARGAWFRWDGARWKDDVEGEALLSTKDVARDYLTDAVGAGDPKTRIDLVKHANKTESKGAREAMLALAASEPGMSVAPAAFDADPWALNVENGVVDLKTGTLRPHNASELHTKLAPVVFDADAKCPRFDRFLEEILPDAEVRTFVLRVFGYALTGVIREHVLPVFYGSGGNGKGTLVETVGGVVGDYGAAVGSDLLMRKQGGDQHPTERASLLKLRLAFASETEAGRALAESTVKTLTGGDTISARFMRQDFFQFEPTHKIVLQTNHRPVIKGTDDGIWRRVRLVPFNVKITGAAVDTSLKATLLTERAGILARLVAACLDWQANGLGSAGAIDEATGDYQTESDVVGAFIDDCCVRLASARTNATSLYAAYVQWANANGEHAWTQTAFGRAMGERGFDKIKSNGTKAYLRIGLLADRGQQGTETVSLPVDSAGDFSRGVNRNNGPNRPGVSPMGGNGAGLLAQSFSSFSSEQSPSNKKEEEEQDLSADAFAARDDSTPKTEWGGDR